MERMRHDVPEPTIFKLLGREWALLPGVSRQLILR